MKEAAHILGNSVKALRHARGMSVADLSDALGISDEWVRRIERGTGKPSLDMIEAASQVFGVPLVVLFSADDEQGRFERLRSAAASLSDQDLAWLLDVIDVLARRPNLISKPFK